MEKRRINLPNFDNVSAGKRALNSLYIGPRYHKITLDYKEDGVRVDAATMRASIEEIVLKINSSEQWRISANRLFDIETGYNPNFEVLDGLINLNFANRAIEGMIQQEATSIGTKGVGTFELEVKVASGVTNPSLQAYAEVDDTSEAPGLIRRLSTRKFAITSTGDFKESLKRRGVSYRALHFFETSAGDVTNLRLQHEGRTYVDHDPAVLRSLIRDYGYDPASKQIMLPLDNGMNGDAMPTQVSDGQSYRDAAIDLTLQMGAAQDVEMVEDFYGLPTA